MSVNVQYTMVNASGSNDIEEMMSLPWTSSNVTNNQIWFYVFEPSNFNISSLDTLTNTFTIQGTNCTINKTWGWSTTADDFLNPTFVSSPRSSWAASTPYLVCKVKATKTGSSTAWARFQSYNIYGTGTMAHPTVTAGDTISKEQMDLLREYKNNSPTAVTIGDTITSTIGSTYGSNATQNTTINASWYNNV